MAGVPPSGSPEFCPVGPAQVPSAEGRTHTLSLSLSLSHAGEWVGRVLPGRRPPWRAAACSPHWHPTGSPLRASTSPEAKGTAPSQDCSLRPHLSRSQPLGDPQTHSLPHTCADMTVSYKALHSIHMGCPQTSSKAGFSGPPPLCLLTPTQSHSMWILSPESSGHE